MTDYKLIATDLDGTLFDSNGALSEENLQAINSLSDKGIKIVLSTGRTLCEIPESLKNNPNISYLIGSNGAAVWDLKTEEKIIDLSCDRSQIERIFGVLNDYQCNTVFRYNGHSFADKNDWSLEKQSYYNICGPHRKAVTAFANFKNDLYSFSKTLENIETFAVFFHSSRELNEARKRLANEKTLRVVDAWDYNLEIFSMLSGKGNALEKLASFLKIPIENTIAVGDSGNDATMILKAGLGLCVSNGVQDLRKISHKIICSNDEHIMEYILKFYCQ